MIAKGQSGVQNDRVCRRFAERGVGAEKRMVWQDDDRWWRREDSLDLRDAGLGNHLAAAVVLAVADQAAALKQSVSRLTHTLATTETHITARSALLLRWWWCCCCCTTCIASGSAAGRCEFGSELQ